MRKCTEYTTSLCLALILLTVLFGCAEQEKKETKASLPQKAHILVAVPFTGDAAAYGKVIKEGVEIALEELKDDPVRDKIKVSYRDSKLSAKEIVNILHQELAVGDVSVVMPASTFESLAVAPICNEKEVVLLPPLADGDQLSDAGPYVFRVSPTSSFQAQVLAKAVLDNKHEKAGVLYLTDAWGSGLGKSFKESYEKLGGKVMAFESCNPGETNLRAQIDKIKSSGVEALVLFVHPKEMVPALKQIRQMDFKAQLYGGDTFSNKAIYNEAANLAQGVIFALPATPENKVFAAFNERYMATYGTKADVNAAAARDAVMLVARAVQGNAVAGEEIMEEFSNIKEGVLGATGLIKWDENGDVISKNYDLFKVKGKEYIKY